MIPTTELPPSLWATTAAPRPDTPPLDGSRTASVAVIGGGYTGLSTALHLVEGGAEVVLLEAAEPGWGASGRNGGQVIPGLKIDPDEIERAYSGGEWPGLARSIIPACAAIVATAPLSENVRRTILPGGYVASDTKNHLLYYRLDRDGRLLMGGVGGFVYPPSTTRFEALERATVKLFPQLGEPRWEYRWGGMFALTTDHLPHLHQPAPSLYIGLGYYGRGIGMATMMGKLLAERVLNSPDAERNWPAIPVRPIPFHWMRRPILEVVAGYYRLQDRAGAWLSR